MSKYDDWIKAYKNKHTYLGGMCATASKEIQKEFPELLIKRGHVIHIGGEKSQHWWCVSPDGKIVDPTSSQFSHKPVTRYEEFIPGEEIRIGKCMECGQYIYGCVYDLDDFSKVKLLYGAKSTLSCSDYCDNELVKAFG